MKGIAVIEMSNELLEEFVQVVKWFVERHEECRVEIFGETDLTAEALQEMFEKLELDETWERKIH